MGTSNTRPSDGATESRLRASDSAEPSNGKAGIFQHISIEIFAAPLAAFALYGVGSSSSILGDPDPCRRTPWREQASDPDRPNAGLAGLGRQPIKCLRLHRLAALSNRSRWQAAAAALAW